ncbi:T9SS type B sorting domain-containing protein [Flavobacterium limnophilum]|uniref:T9SS type B sorting domain-containing protein n=1 Tax=Flavobacterium limnophilum TaxID=3003262 RepID=UPI002482DF25|nr:T9SS type B sorting domain-containing protein [Flavobacterium limnophilum]
MMKKLIKLFVFLFLITILSSSSTFAKSGISGFANMGLAPVPPIVTTPVYLCQNSVAVPLTATPSGGGTLTWYAGLSGGIALPGAPTPSTTTVGSTTYYVTETVAGVESTPRTPIVVNVVADSGGVLTLFCDAANTTPTSVAFDWNNVIGYLGYNYSYSVAGEPLVTGFQVAPSHFDVPVPGPGTTVKFTILSVLGLPCVKSISVTCNSTCTIAQSIAPKFTPIPSFCSGTPAPSLPATSLEGISGTWSPATISNTASGNYVFTPDPILFPCALIPAPLAVTVTSMVSPTFSGIPAVVCQGAPAPVLPLISSNATPITGTWSPFPVDTSTLGTTDYTFIPTPGQSCVSATPTTASIRIDPVLTPTFTQIGAICSGGTLLALPTTSNNGITGSWSPALNNTATTLYTFTPTAGQCATTTTMSITVNTNVTPTFNGVGPICSGDILAPLPTLSNNGINGTWSPSLNNTTTTTYIFAPSSGQCATTTPLTIVVNPLVEPSFVDLSICSGSTPPNLDTMSPNGITGNWMPSSIDNTTNGAYVFTPDAPQCATVKTINVTVNPSNTLVAMDWTVTDAFTKNQIVTIVATGSGNYLYQMDSGPFQTSPVFENVAYGMHSITVKDVNSCSTQITETNVLVIGYPKYFTPNGDTYNDTWNIFDLKDQVASRIYIFDRYGKLLKDISPKGSGWDGTYIGQPMPAADYWFTVEYSEQGITKKFNSHFSLKR